MRPATTRTVALLSLVTCGALALTGCSNSQTYQFESKTSGPARSITATFPNGVLESEDGQKLLIQSVTTTARGEESDHCLVNFTFEYSEGAVEILSEPELTEEQAESQRGGYIISFYEALLVEAQADLKLIGATSGEYPALDAAITETKDLYKNGEYLAEWDQLMQPAFGEIEQVFLLANKVTSFAEYVEASPNAAERFVIDYSPSITDEAANLDVDPTLAMDLSGGMTSYIVQVVHRISGTWKSRLDESMAVAVEARLADTLGFPLGAPLEEYDPEAPLPGAYFTDDSMAEALVVMPCSDFDGWEENGFEGPTQELRFLFRNQHNTAAWDSTYIEYSTDRKGQIVVANAQVGSTFGEVLEDWPDASLRG